MRGVFQKKRWSLLKMIPRLSIVIPVFNEKETLEVTTSKSLELLGSFAKELEIILVDDGCTDGSRDLIKAMARQNPLLKGVFHPQNLGIGQALLSGYQVAEGDWIALLPADLQFNPLDLTRASPYLNEADIICFYRPERKEYSFYRRFVSHTNRWFNGKVFGLEVRDVNWVKLYRSWVIHDIPIKSRTPFVESERLIRAKRQGAKIVEITAPYFPRVAGKAKGSKLKTVARSFLDMLCFCFERKR